MHKEIEMLLISNLHLLLAPVTHTLKSAGQAEGGTWQGQPLWVGPTVSAFSSPSGCDTQMHGLWLCQFLNFRLLGLTVHQGTDCSSLVGA